MAVEALGQISDSSRSPAGFHFRDVAIQKALIVPPTDSIEIQLTLRPSKASNRNLLQWNSFRICVFENEDWTEICTGETAVEYSSNQDDHERAAEEEYARSEPFQEHEAGRDICSKTVNEKDVYEHFEKLGISYGPSFATLKDIRYNNHGGTTAKVNLYDWRKGLAQHHRVQDHVIHPAALDAIFQSVFAALTEGGTKTFPTLVPTKFRSLWIAADLYSLDDAEVKVFTKANFIGLRNAHSSIRAISAVTAKPFVIGGYEMTFVSGHEKPRSSGAGSNRLCYYMDWKPDLTLLDSNQVTDYCSSGMDAEFADSRLQHEEEKRLACYMAMFHSLEYPPSEDVLIVKPYLKRYFEWMKHQIASNSEHDLSTPGEQWKVGARDPGSLRQILDKVQNYDAEGGVISSVATNLPGILSGEVDGLNLLFGENSLMEQYYRYAHSSTSAFSKVERYVDALAHRNSGLRVLEIGAGTGGATELILQALMRQNPQSGGSPRLAEYVYTDISPTFFEKAKMKFQSALERMTFATLNIEQDPLEQGFQQAGYDLVIASHVGSLVDIVCNY